MLNHYFGENADDEEIKETVNKIENELKESFGLLTLFAYEIMMTYSLISCYYPHKNEVTFVIITTFKSNLMETILKNFLDFVVENKEEKDFVENVNQSIQLIESGYLMILESNIRKIYVDKILTAFGMADVKVLTTISKIRKWLLDYY